MAPSGPVTDDDVTRARELREALHGLARAAASEQAPAARDVRVVNTSLLEALPVELRRSGTSMTVGRSGDGTTGARTARPPGGRRPDGAPTAPGFGPAGTTSARGSLWIRRDAAAGAPTSVCGVKARVRAHRARKRDSGAS